MGIIILILIFLILIIGYKIILKRYEYKNDLYSYFLMKNFLLLILLQIKGIDKIIFEIENWSISISNQIMKITNNKTLKSKEFKFTLVKGGNLFEVHYNGNNNYKELSKLLPLFQIFIRENISKNIKFRTSLININKWE